MATKSTPKVETPAAKLLVPQLRILRVLAKNKAGGLTKAQIVERAEVPSTWVAEYLGGTAEPASDEVRGAKKLVPAGLAAVIAAPDDLDGRGKTYAITEAGRKLLASLNGKAGK